MAADILIHKAVKVPVGKDQEQHLEMARTFGNRFNRLYHTEYFPEPFAFTYAKSLVKVPGLDGKGKMGKSEGVGNVINLSDTPEIIRKKIMKAVTDMGPTITAEGHAMQIEIQKTRDAFKIKSPPIQNLFDLMKLVSNQDTLDFFENEFNLGAIRYGDLKKQLAEDMIIALQPMREKIADIAANTDYLRKVARHGAEKARESASKTIKEVRELIGFRSF
jgi:tryptophanyl-tRNA synthetase